MAAAMKDAYKALQIPGARMANDAYRELLRLGVVNSNVRLGDLQRLLQEVLLTDQKKFFFQLKLIMEKMVFLLQVC